MTLNPKKARKAAALVSELLSIESELEEHINQLQLRETKLLDALVEVLHSKPVPESTPEE
jgi:hypothetical protein